MRILALDPSASTGWALHDGHQVSEAGFEKFESSEHEGQRLLDAYRWLRDLLELWKPDLVLQESYFFSSRFATGSSVNSELRGVFKMALAEKSIPLKVVDPSSWKKRLTGRVYPTKAEKKKYGKSKAKKMVTYLSLEALGFKFPTHVIGKSGRKVQLPFDVTDAIGILVSHLQEVQIPLQISTDLFEDTAK